jgi:ABC-type dipeptide/oligopeptide/nickel transport system permease component
MIVWGTLVAAGVIVLEAALSILNFGVELGTAIVFTVTLFVVVLSVAADVGSAWLDPRVRARNQRALIALPRVLRRAAVA